MISTRFNDFISRIAMVLSPTGSEMIARDRPDDLRKLYLTSSRFLFLFNASLTAAVCALAQPLLRYWVGPQFATAGSIALVLFMLSQGVNAASMSAGYLNYSAARPGVNLMFSVANSAIAIGLIYPLTAWLGVTGAALASLVGSSMVAPFLWYSHRKVLHIGSLSVFRSSYVGTLAAVCILAPVASLVVSPLATNLVTALSLLFVTFAANMLLSSLLGAVKRDEARRLTVFAVRLLRSAAGRVAGWTRVP
jgi:O-antigen/teichoic acid export membrane protein